MLHLCCHNLCVLLFLGTALEKINNLMGQESKSWISLCEVTLEGVGSAVAAGGFCFSVFQFSTEPESGAQ